MARIKGSLNQKTMITYIKTRIPGFDASNLSKEEVKEKYTELKNKEESNSGKVS